MNRVAVTGIGLITPIGCSIDVFWDNLVNGRHGISRIDSFDLTGYKVSLAAQVRDIDFDEYIDKKEARRMDRYCKFGVAAARMAIDDCGSEFKDLDPFRVGVLLGSGVGGLNTLEQEHKKLIDKGSGRVSPFFIPMMISNIASGYISINYGFKGPNYTLVSACASSAHSVGEAFRAIKHGYADVVITGGCEATITPLSIAGFSSMTALYAGDDVDRASIPFDKERSGFVMGEGAGVLVLERLDHALSRGAKIYGEIVGYGATGDAYHITSPDPEGEGAVKAMEFAIRDSGINKEDIGYINAHGTSTPLNDKIETKAIKKCFADYAYKIPVSSTKSMTGHLLGAAGAVEAVVSILGLKNGLLPPTINYKLADPECDLDYITDGPRKTDAEYALSNSLGFGGHNASVCFKKYE